MGRAYPGTGLKNFYYAPITYDDLYNTVVYGAPVRIYNGVSLNESPQNNQETQYADDSPAFTAASKGAKEITIEQSALSHADIAALVGMDYDAGKKELTEGQTDKPDAVAFGWEEPTSDPGESRFHWLLWVEFVEDAKDYTTATDAPQFSTKTLKGLAKPRPSDGLIKKSVDTHDDATMTAATWFTDTKLNAFV